MSDKRLSGKKQVIEQSDPSFRISGSYVCVCVHVCVIHVLKFLK